MEKRKGVLEREREKNELRTTRDYFLSDEQMPQRQVKGEHRAKVKVAQIVVKL